MRVVLAAIALLLIFEGVMFSVLVKGLRMGLEIIGQRSDAELWRAGVYMLLVGLGLIALACVI
jgi:uncharacterized protein YjeT (DUF2065 family)